MKRPAGMSPRDVEVWRAACVAWPLLDLDPLFNVRVGRGADPGMHNPSLAGTPAARDWQKRVDVVLYRGPLMWAVEVKPIGDGRAAGQALLYAQLLAAEFPFPRPVIPTVLCWHIDADLRPFLDEWRLCWLEVADQRVTLPPPALDDWDPTA